MPTENTKFLEKLELLINDKVSDKPKYCLDHLGFKDYTLYLIRNVILQFLNENKDLLGITRDVPPAKRFIKNDNKQSQEIWVSLDDYIMRCSKAVGKQSPLGESSINPISNLEYILKSHDSYLELFEGLEDATSRLAKADKGEKWRFVKARWQTAVGLAVILVLTSVTAKTCGLPMPFRLIVNNNTVPELPGSSLPDLYPEPIPEHAGQIKAKPDRTVKQKPVNTVKQKPVHNE